MKKNTVVWRKALLTKLPCLEREDMPTSSCCPCCWSCEKLDSCISIWKKGKIHCFLQNMEVWCPPVLLAYIRAFQHPQNMTDKELEKYVYLEYIHRAEKRIIGKLRRINSKEVSK